MDSAATTVANAAGAVLTRTLLGIGLGVVVGITAFVVEKSAGWLDGSSGWAGAALVWALLPLYMAAGAAAVGYAGFWSGIRRAAHVALVESGALRRMVARLLARARKAAATRAGAAAADADTGAGGDEPAPRGWIGARVAALGRSIAHTIVDRLAAAGAPEADTGEQVDRIAGELIDEVGVVPSIIALALLAAVCAAPPLLLA